MGKNLHTLVMTLMAGLLLSACQNLAIGGSQERSFTLCSDLAALDQAVISFSLEGGFRALKQGESRRGYYRMFADKIDGPQRMQRGSLTFHRFGSKEQYWFCPLDGQGMKGCLTLDHSGQAHWRLWDCDADIVTIKPRYEGAALAGGAEALVAVG